MGLGPGGEEHLSPRARQVLEQAGTIAGYKNYIKLLEPDLLQDKKLISTGMTAEIERCNQALDAAEQGEDTALVCSGDPGIYALAGLVLELLQQRPDPASIPVQIIPGVPAMCAASALLGAPLGHDFASVSLSDLLTPWEVIENRLHAAGQADFSLVLYNPRSNKRHWQLEKAIEIMLEYRSPETPVGVVRNAGRKGEQVLISNLDRIQPELVDMSSIVLIGSSQTRVQGLWMFTPRGYMQKYAQNKGE
ncbi:MAG: precorrin-3B C(17)-methyltransferase [Desulfohalobiaceae bacterium]